MGAQCAKVDVIPDKETMYEIVDKIAAFEEVLKRGDELTHSQKRDLKRLQAVSRTMKRANVK